MKIEPIVDIKKWRSARLVSHAWNSETRVRMMKAALESDDRKMYDGVTDWENAPARLKDIARHIRKLNSFPIIDYKGFKVSRIMAYKIGKYTHFYNMPLEQTLLQKVYYFFKNLWLGAK